MNRRLIISTCDNPHEARMTPKMRRLVQAKTGLNLARMEMCRAQRAAEQAIADLKKAALAVNAAGKDLIQARIDLAGR